MLRNRLSGRVRTTPRPSRCRSGSKSLTKVAARSVLKAWFHSPEIIRFFSLLPLLVLGGTQKLLTHKPSGLFMPGCTHMDGRSRVNTAGLCAVLFGESLLVFSGCVCWWWIMFDFSALMSLFCLCSKGTFSCLVMAAHGLMCHWVIWHHFMSPKGTVHLQSKK